MPSCRRRVRSLALLCLALLAAGVPARAEAGRPPQVHVWVVDSLTKVFPDAPPGEATSASLDACPGEWESFQVVLRSEGGLPPLSLSASDLRSLEGRSLPAGCVDLFLEHFVPIEHPSGNAVAEPREWPDALLPMRIIRRAEVTPGRSLAFWVTVRVPPNARPGRYHGTLTLSAGERRLAEVPFSLRVWGLLLPAANHQGALAALYLDNVREYLNKHYREGRPPLAGGTREWQALKERYWRFLLDYRICPYDLPVPVESPGAGAFLRDERLARFRAPWLGEDAEQFGRQMEALRRHGALARGVYYQFDEPRMEQYPQVRALAERVRAVEPSLRRLLTLFPTPDLEGAVEVWCPDIGDTFGPGYLDHEILQQRRAAGEETWWYTMCVPRYPYPTWLVDDDATAHRVFCWMQALYGITGFVYSQVHGWSDDPYRDVSSFAGSNGDGLLIYPGDPFGSPEPFPSIRLQVIRDALEDYECLRLLREGTLDALRTLGTPDAEALAQGVVAAYCRRLVASERAFSRRPEDYALARRDLLEEILSCRARPRLVVGLSDSGPAMPRQPWGGMGGPGFTLTIAAEAGAQVDVDHRPVALDEQGRGTCAVRALVGPVLVRARKEGRERVLRRWPPRPAEVMPELPRVACPLLKRAPAVDGVIGAEEWRGASVVKPGLRANGLGPAGARTECFLARDSERLYFAARCHLGSAGPQPISPFPHSPVSSLPEEQSIALILDPPPLGDAKLELLMAGTGKRYATLRTRRGHVTPRLGWRWAQRAGEGAWECEMSLEFGGLLPAPGPGAEWGANIERGCGSEQAVWALSYGDVRRLGRVLFRDGW